MTWRADGERGEAGHDERFAALAGRDQRRRGRILAELSLLLRNRASVGHVAVGAVGVLRPHDHLLRLALAVEHGTLSDTVRRATGVGTVGGSCGAPASSQRTSVW